MTMLPLSEKRAELLMVVEEELRNGNLVLVFGGPCTGKSWLINQLFDKQDVIDKSSYELRGVDAKVSLELLNNLERFKALAIDEIQLLDETEINEAVNLAVSNKAGLLIATCSSPQT